MRGDVAYLVATGIQSFPCSGNTNARETLIDPGDLLIADYYKT